MISGFLTSVIQFHSNYASISVRLTLIIDFYHLLRLFSSEAFDKRTNRVSTDVADKHARYMKARLLLSPAKSKVTNRLGDNGAHRCVDYCFCKRTIISAAKVRHCKRKDCPDALFLCRENGGQQVMFFWHLHVLPPIRGFAYLIKE